MWRGRTHRTTTRRRSRPWPRARIAAHTLSTADEAIGIARAARAAGIPATLSFTRETDGRLPSGTALPEAIAAVDAATGGYPDFYMINCAHPVHFAHLPDSAPAWAARIGGRKANASTASHATPDDGDPDDLTARTAATSRPSPGPAAVNNPPAQPRMDAPPASNLS